MSVDIRTLSNGVEGVFVKNSRFNTTLISFNFYLPIDKERVADFALLPFMLTTCSEKYPDFSALNLKLSKLYGANLTASAEKVGDYQLLKMAISVIEDKYTFDEDSLTIRASELLRELIFNPKLENEAFCDEDIQREKRKAAEHILGEMSDKRVYAKTRLIEEMYEGEVYGTAKCGTLEQVEKITGKSLYNAWLDMLKSSYVRVNVVSSSLPQGFFDAVGDSFNAFTRENIPNCRINAPTKHREEVKMVEEYIDVAQGKLVMGFSSDCFGDDTKTLPLMVAVDIFGGGPYSRLFTYVREKQSLCYYCSATAVRTKGFVSVSSGVEKENIKKAESEILKQLECVKNGEFTDFEFESSIKNTVDSLLSSNDSQETVDLWYSIKIANEKLLSPEDLAEMISSVTRQEVIEAAKQIKLNTVYRLLPKED